MALPHHHVPTSASLAFPTVVFALVVALRLASAAPAPMAGDLLEKRNNALFSSFQAEQGLHQAAALSAMTLLITAHRAIMNTGFVLRQRSLSTDAWVVLTVGLVTCIWTTLVVLSGLLFKERPCRASLEACLARMSYAPWMLQILFFFWLIAFWDEVSYLRSKDVEHRMRLNLSDSSIAETKHAWLSITLPRILGFRIWKLECSRGPSNWSGSVDPKFRWLLYGTITSVVVITAYGAIRGALYSLGLLNLVGVVLFVAGAGGANMYAGAPHVYNGDMLRIALTTRHREGTVYILPFRNRGFDAVWSPKIDYEHREVDALSNSEAEGRRRDLRHILAAFNESTELDPDAVNDLAGWLYEPEKHPTMQQIKCKRAPGIHLIGSSIMFALWHSEYLVFMRRGLLQPDYERMVGSLRSPKLTGADLDASVRQVGNLPGLEGYQEAVRYVYRLFDQPVDDMALNPTSPTPKTSIVLDKCPDTIEDYTAQLWDHCITAEESTFAALYAFTCYWVSDVGSDATHGWHQFPLRAWDREGDLVSWHVVWRQAWYSAIIAQLTSMSPVILSAFAAGILQ
ncbi:hypothetical protein FGG08_001452 [Glutinoglossum americanum]|uniref:Uncharacterized protein n=1 Tax=Glutinoglossum americanum TaxID=1670608 RepID=A0A9P8L5B2_9PEZI|nr:hypothetical protein FGG08_001452 [Glutinoglossum americanum]